MRVVYETVLAQMERAIKEADSQGRKIIAFELTEEEVIELKTVEGFRFAQYEIPTFMGIHLRQLSKI